MARMNYGAMVLQNESPFSQFLGGMGQGVSYRVQKSLEEEERTKRIGEMLMQSALSGELDPRFLATQEAEAFIKSLGLDKDSGIAALVSQGKAANAPLEAPVTTEMPSKTKGMSGPLVNIPQPQASAKQVRESVLGEESGRALASKQAEANIALMKEYTLHVMKEAHDRGQTLSPEEVGARLRRFQQAAGIQGQIKVTLDKTGAPTVTLDEVDPTQAASRTRTNMLNLNDYLDPVARLHTSRAQAVKDLGAILRGDLESVNDWAAQAGMAPEAAKLISGAIAALGDTKGKPRLKPADAAQLYIAAVNKAFDIQNKANADRAALLKLPGDRVLADRAEALTFEEVAGRPRDAWDDRVGDPDATPDAAGGDAEKVAKAAAEEARKRAAATPANPPKPDAGKADDKAKQIDGLYKEVTKLVVEARAANPKISSDEIVASMRELKDDIMAEYGLSDREYQLVEDMIKQVATRKK